MLLLRVAADIGEWQNDDREARRRGFFGRRSRRGLRHGGLADVERIDPDRFRDVLELCRAEIGDSDVESPFDLPVGLLGQADRAGLGDALQPRGDIDAVAHQVAVGLLDDVAEMNADAKLDPPLGWHARVALDEAVLHLDGAAHRVDHAAELDETAVAGALDDPPVVRGDGGIDQVTAQPSEPRERAVLVGAGEPAVADYVGDQDRPDFSGLAHGAPSRAMQNSTKTAGTARLFIESLIRSPTPPPNDRYAQSGRSRSRASIDGRRRIASTPSYSSVPFSAFGAVLSSPIAL